jgi:mono/diheme cytochrome c family protein
LKRAILLASLVTVSAHAAPPGPNAPSGPPPGPPPYQMRATAPAGDRLVAARDGAALFSNLCGACHLPGGMGTNMLTKQRMMLGEPPDSGLLANRKDLTQTYVKFVVRRGRMAMPSLTRVEVTDAELDAIAAYLGTAGP